MTELAEPSPERSVPRVGSGGADYGDADTEMRISYKIEIWEGLRDGRRKLYDSLSLMAYRFVLIVGTLYRDVCVLYLFPTFYKVV